MLSQVAKSFRDRVPLSTHTKDSLEYKESFLGREGVDTIALIIKTTDRNLALLLGRALDAQKFFHDVTYMHRLRDSPVELYAFQEYLGLRVEDGVDQDDVPDTPMEDGLPNGVFTLLTDCYSPTCTRERLCYSIACPRRLEQQTRLLNQTSHQLQRTPSRLSLSDDQDKLWSTTVPKDVLESVSDTEKKRQEIIFEIVKTEKEFVDDLELLQKLYIEPLRSGSIIPQQRRERFIHDVFLNVSELISINSKLRRALAQRQKERHVVERVGDVFAGVVGELDPYVDYGAKQPHAKHILDHEVSTNPEFARFLQECERKPESRKLPIQSFLGRPTTRMGRYPLLLKSLLEKTPEDHIDQRVVPPVMDAIKDILTRINIEVGKANNQLKLSQLASQLPAPIAQELRLRDKGRELIREGTLLKRGNNETELMVYLFDHALLLAKRKHKNGHFKFYRKPMNLQLISLPSDRAGGASRRHSGLFNSTGKSAATASLAVTASMPPARGSTVAQNDPLSSRAFSISFAHLGREGQAYTLYTNNQAERKLWKEAIENQKLVVTERNRKFEIVTLLDNVFEYPNRVTCSCEWEGRLLLGTDQGLFMGPDERKAAKDRADGTPRRYQRALDLERIMQVDVVVEFDLLIVLADKNLWTFPLDVLEIIDYDASARKGRKMGSHYSFFKQGYCMDRTLICAVKSAALSTTIKVFEPIAPGGKKGKGIGRLFRGGDDQVKLYQELFIPTESTSVDFLKRKLCVGCTKGFEIIDLESLDTMGLLDTNDPGLGFVTRREHIRPISIFKVQDGNYLLCYAEFGFYINKLGGRARPDWMIHWEGTPTAFSYVYPYIIAFEPNFIEIRHVDTGALQQVILSHGLRVLNPNPDAMHCVMDGNGEYQHVFRLRNVPKV
ncbi:RHO1 GDP-GTP exchange protein 2 [Rhizophlyctis rosea]|uniref:RHO1 GDP-GTP exchange protein 2 n=1 Tax=Rhizophlyctis rosea TaxID=64517 RepID=A0AAD5SJE1_9FUNG|nr:RHO1 GDP-GTP exchange protein 2 [Rhizophlyctis rosea]